MTDIHSLPKTSKELGTQYSTHINSSIDQIKVKHPPPFLL